MCTAAGSAEALPAHCRFERITAARICMRSRLCRIAAALPCAVYKGRLRPRPVGGTKNKSPAQKERSQASKKPDFKKSKKGGKEGDGASQSSPSVEIRVVMTDAQAKKAMASSRTVTAHNLARQAGVKISAAHAYLRGAAERGLVKAVGGKSGHRVYAVVDTKVPAKAPGMASTLGTTSGSSKTK